MPIAVNLPMDSMVIDSSSQLGAQPRRPTCAHNDTALEGDDYLFAAFNPTNRRFGFEHKGARGVSTEAGHLNGDGAPLLTTPGGARRAIYIPAFRSQVERWLSASESLRDRVERLRSDPRPAFLRDYDTGRGIDRDGPMSHAWVLAMWLNTGEWPGSEPAPEPRQPKLFEGV